MNRKTQAAIRKLKDADATILAAAGGSGRQGGADGPPARRGEEMPDAAANTLSIAFGDLPEAIWSLTTGVPVLRDQISAKPYVLFSTPQSASAAGSRTSMRSSC